ncbi:MAG: SDR family oxidoreductase [Rhizorhabdus sp.]|uniref:SDR family NAD(P)-dependent oxidoreductase n=1 Tax=Rhizorhabdus sp. TaxID=1968843 RepID=UPI001B63A0DA|nr:SDR family NAD(P)-dependent oxidoreductase [Rhizorhabdus sp.]MBP8235199.1 SDR family oxidoreductase [Rhizorhabdus sp.]
MIDLTGKVAVITGGAAGIGQATARKMTALGASVVIADVDMASADALVDELTAAGSAAAAVRADILVESDIEAMLAFAVDRFGGLDILHNNAGIPRTIAPDSEVALMDATNWRRTLDGHLTSAMLGCKYAIPHMITRGGGSIVNTSSSSAIAATMDLAAYSSAKAGLHALTREVAVTYGRDNIRCNAVVPGAVLTARGRATLPPDIFRLFAEETPLPRLSMPEDIADAVVFLASEASRMITGQALVVDGGMQSKLPYWLPKMKATRGDRFDETTFAFPED